MRYWIRYQSSSAVSFTMLECYTFSFVVKLQTQIAVDCGTVQLYSENRVILVSSLMTEQ